MHNYSNTYSNLITKLIHELGSIAVMVITELLDQKKAAYKYLSISELEFSYNYSMEDHEQSLMGIRATNDEAESVLGGETANIQRYGCISLSGAGAVGDMTWNAFLHRPTKSQNTVKPLGKFYQFDPSLQEAIILTAISDPLSTQKKN